MNSIIKRCIIFLIVLVTTGLIAWSCSQTDGNCLSIAGFDLNYIKYKADKYNDQVFSPLVNNIHEGYDYIGKTNLKTAYNTAVYDGSSLRIVRVANWLYHGYIQPPFNAVQHKISDSFTNWKNQLIDYVNNPQYDDELDEHDDDLHLAASGMVEDNIKKTAKRIMDYIDQVNQESAKSGMKREDARKKAHEIINEIAHPNTIQHESNVEMKEDEEAQSPNKDISKVAFEIREIVMVAQHQREQLEARLSSIKAYLSPALLKQQDSELLASALKSEIDQMRQAAEDQVRARANQALSQSYPSLTDAVMARVKSDIHSAQRGGLRNLREVNSRIYEVNEAIDNLFNQKASV